MKNKFFPGNVFQCCIFILVYMLFAGFLSLLLAKTTGNSNLLLHIYFSAGSAIIILLTHWRNSSSGERIKYDFRIVKGSLLMMLFFVTVVFHLGIIFPVFRGLLPVESTSGPLTSIDNLIGYVILTPVFEEIIFRNIVLKGLLIKYSVNKSIIISSLLFALVHTDIAHIYWGKIVTALFLGLFLGWLFYKTGRIGLCIVVHSFSNLIAIATYSLNNYIHTNFSYKFFPISAYWLTPILATIFILLILRRIKKKIKIFKQ
jgi:uncharacterized protein